LHYIITIEDVKKLIAEREHSNDKWNKDIMLDALHARPKSSSSSSASSSSGSTHFGFQQYHSYDEMRTFMHSLEKTYPNIVKVTTIGYSVQNRPIEMIKIGYPINSNSKKSIWIDAGIHAREWAAHSTAMFFINELVTKYDKDPQITQYVKNLTWYIAPVVNPDGYEYSRSSQDPETRLWRKNMSPNSDKCKWKGGCCKGVDLNRNFDFHWSESGSSSNPCEEDYQGPSAFSEPESRTVRDFVLGHKNELEAFITLHTYSQLWLHPFGHAKNSYPTDINDLRSVGAQATDALKKMYGTKYTVGSGADTLYLASGGSDDWAKAVAGIKYVYLIELRPSELVWDGFILPSSQIIPTGRETWEGVKIVVNKVLEKNGFRLDTAKSRALSTL
jgi:hypothetical protein